MMLVSLMMIVWNLHFPSYCDCTWDNCAWLYSYDLRDCLNFQQPGVYDEYVFLVLELEDLLAQLFECKF